MDLSGREREGRMKKSFFGSRYTWMGAGKRLSVCPHFRGRGFEVGEKIRTGETQKCEVWIEKAKIQDFPYPCSLASCTPTTPRVVFSPLSRLSYLDLSQLNLLATPTEWEMNARLWDSLPRAGFDSSRIEVWTSWIKEESAFDRFDYVKEFSLDSWEITSWKICFSSFHTRNPYGNLTTLRYK